MTLKTRKYSVDEVIRSLTKKGCIITLAEPLTKMVDDVEMPDVERIKKKYTRYIQKQDVAVITSDVELLGEDVANDKWFNKFKLENPSLFVANAIKRTIIVQAPYVVNTVQANELGNGSWGKIDFLCNYNGFTLKTV